MSFVFDLFNGLVDALGEVLQFFFRSVTEPAFGPYGWIGAIILLTLAVRVALLPLAVKQTKSMKAMQALQPEMKKIQAKYKTDKGLARTDPEKYRAQKAKQQEATMALYKEQGVNPAASCLPLILQMPIFFALYRVLLGGNSVEALQTAPWFGGHVLSDTASTAGFFAIVLIAFMGITTFVSQRQMMARQTVSSEQASQQKILLYAMPAMLTFFGFNLPVGVLIYWVTTNLWTMGQQYVIFRSAGEAPGTEGGPTPAAAKQEGGRKGLMSRLQDMAAEQAARSESRVSGAGDVTDTAEEERGARTAKASTGGGGKPRSGKGGKGGGGAKGGGAKGGGAKARAGGASSANRGKGGKGGKGGGGSSGKGANGARAGKADGPDGAATTAGRSGSSKAGR